MKQISQDILSIIDGDVINKRNEFSNISETLGISTAQIGDETFSTLLTSLNFDIEILKEAINKGIIDSLSSSTRDSLKVHITNLSNSAKDLFIDKTNTDYIPFVTSATNILNFVDQYSIDFQLKNIPDYKKKLEEIKILKEKLEKLNSDSTGAKNNLIQSQELLKNLTEKFSSSEKVQSDLNSIVENAKNIFSSLEESKNQIQAKIVEVETFYTNQYKLLNDAILKSDTGLQATIDFTNQKHVEAKDFAERAAASYSALSSSVAEYTTSLQTLTNTNNAIQTLFTKINDPEQGVDKKFKTITETKSKIDELYSKSTESFKIISDLEIKITTIFNDSSEKLKAISDAKEKAETTFSEIEKIYGITADTAMGGEFNNKAKDSYNDFTEWGKRIFWLTITLLGVIIFLFCLPLFCSGADLCIDNVKTPDFLIRLTLTSPIIFYLFFCTNQYKRAKENYYKYSFKATLAFSIKNHINLLADNPKFQKESDTKTILDFAIKGLDKIYDEPYFDESMKHKFKIKEYEIKFGTKQ